MRCPVCNNTISDGSSFCPVCGTAFQPPQYQPAYQQQPVYPPVNQYPVQPMPPANQYPVQPASPVYESKGAGIVAFIFGLIGLLCSIIAPLLLSIELFRYLTWYGWVRAAISGIDSMGFVFLGTAFLSSLIGTITGSVSSGRSPHFGLGRAGKTLAIIGLVFSSVCIFFLIIFVTIIIDLIRF